jgi:bacterioferritin-associated ferredoxin
VKLFLGILVACAAAAQTPRPFSHELHLKLPNKFTCVSCHASVRESTRVEDNNLPAEAVCKGCHERVSIRPRPTGILTKFDHKRHLAFGDIAPLIRGAIDSKAYLSQPGDIRRQLETGNQCAACHRGMEQSAAPAKHDFPRMADCLVCHNKIDPPFSCEQCHDKGEHLKPASHNGPFLDTHNRKGALSAADKETCAVCHGRRFTCLGCH